LQCAGRSPGPPAQPARPDPYSAVSTAAAAAAVEQWATSGQETSRYKFVNGKREREKKAAAQDERKEEENATFILGGVVRTNIAIKNFDLTFFFL
jgi:hypothetical protein